MPHPAVRPARVVVLLLLGLATADAAPAAPAAPAADDAPGFGARIGGYGFRRDRGGDRNAWDLCRMNGLGVFVDAPLRGALFVEAGLDLYFSEPFPEARPAGDLPIDRASALLAVAAGARAHLAPWLRAYAQVGAGVEATRVSVPYGDGAVVLRDTQALPELFLGAGGDLALGRRTYLGANLRALVMGNFDYDPAGLRPDGIWPVPPPAERVFAASPALAAQAQFYLRHDL